VQGEAPGANIPACTATETQMKLLGQPRVWEKQHQQANDRNADDSSVSPPFRSQDEKILVVQLVSQQTHKIAWWAGGQLCFCDVGGERIVAPTL